MTPHQALYSTNPKLLPTYTAGSASVVEVDDLLLTRQQLHVELEDNLQKAQTRMKKFADSHRQDKVFEVGQWV